jgi:hypothetical protein
MSGVRPTRREGPGQLCCVRPCRGPHTDFQENLSSNKCMMHIVVRVYEASQMGMRLARPAAIVLPTTHGGHQPGMGAKGADRVSGATGYEKALRR